MFVRINAELSSRRSDVAFKLGQRSPRHDNTRLHSTCAKLESIRNLEFLRSISNPRLTASNHRLFTISLRTRASTFQSSFFLFAASLWIDLKNSPPIYISHDRSLSSFFLLFIHEHVWITVPLINNYLGRTCFFPDIVNSCRIGSHS